MGGGAGSAYPRPCPGVFGVTVNGSTAIRTTRYCSSFGEVIASLVVPPHPDITPAAMKAGAVSTASREASEVPDDPQPFALALLRMELAGEDVVARDAGNEGPPIVGHRARDGLIIGHDVIRVDEIHERAIGHPVEHGRALPDRDRVPPHVWHLHRRRGAP